MTRRVSFSSIKIRFAGGTTIGCRRWINASEMKIKMLVGDDVLIRIAGKLLYLQQR